MIARANPRSVDLVSAPKRGAYGRPRPPRCAPPPRPPPHLAIALAHSSWIDRRLQMTTGEGTIETWEGVAAAVHRATGLDDPPVCAFELATCCGLVLRPWARAGASLEGDVVRYPAGARRVRQQGLVAHELGHWALDWCGEDQSEAGANFVAGALMLPRARLDADLTATGWDLRALRAKHVNCSVELIARRIVELRDAVVTVFDQGNVTRRVASPWLEDRFARVTPLERELADRALDTEEVQRPAELLWAVPVLDGPHRRVVVVAEAEQLSLRLER